jgi:hypothetical protein
MVYDHRPTVTDVRLVDRLPIATHAVFPAPVQPTQPHHEQSPIYVAFLVLGSSSGSMHGSVAEEVGSDQIGLRTSSTLAVQSRPADAVARVLSPPYWHAVSKRERVAALALAETAADLTIVYYICAYDCILI